MDRNPIISHILPVFLFLFLAACAGKETGHGVHSPEGVDFPYRLDAPDRTWELPASLVEISGLGYIDANRLACIQDEEGIIFIYNLELGQVEEEKVFGSSGDYEGIEIVGDDAWILKSNGTLYEVPNFMGEEVVARKHGTSLSRRNDPEGLAFHPGLGALLIACKGFPFHDGRDGAHLKAIYRFDVADRTMQEEPFLLIDLDTVRHYRHVDGMTSLGIEIMSTLDPSKGDKSFQPSGLAVHPESGDLYVLGSVGKLLLIFSAEGELKSLLELDPSVFVQPEGICFSPEGILYISSEGKGRNGTLLKFRPHNKGLK